MLFSRTPLIAVVGAGLLLSGCATKESVEHAQASADQANQTANSAMSAAQHAQSSADDAMKEAQDAEAKAMSVSDRLDRMEAERHRVRHHVRRHHHYRKQAANAVNPACPAPQPSETPENKPPNQ